MRTAKPRGPDISTLISSLCDAISQVTVTKGPIAGENVE
jgi:hypothetical protein